MRWRVQHLPRPDPRCNNGVCGVYLLIRAFPLLQASEALPVIAGVGAATALFASVVAIAQNDIKRVLAFSTISQLGYMVAAVGIGAYAAAVFHLITHAFFKALLFLAAGSVIHGIEHGHQHTFGHAVPLNAAEMDFSLNDMWKMGGFGLPYATDGTRLPRREHGACRLSADQRGILVKG